MQLPAKIVLTALGMGILFDALLYHVFYPGINVLLLEIIFLTVLYLYAHKTKIDINTDAHIATVFAVLFAITFAIWTSNIGMILAFFGFVISNVILIFSFAGHSLKYQHPFQFVLDSIVHPLKLIALRFDILANLSFTTTKKRNAALLRGIIIAIPVVLIFGALFLRSDLVLQYKTDGFITWLSDQLNVLNVIPNVLIIGFFSISFLLILAALFWKRFDFTLPASYSKNIATESLVVLLASNILFLGFLIFQGVYLFGGQAAFNTIPEITYSQYAVKGFGELAFVSVLVILLILSLRYFHGPKHASNKLHLAEVILLIETLALLISAWMRLSLYVEQYGFTPARLFGFWFFITVGLLLVWLVAHIWKRFDQSMFVRQSAIILGMCILAFVIITPDALSVRLNISRAEVSGEAMDPFPLFYDLSAEAYPLMDYVLTSGQVDIGLMDTSIEDYCPHIRFNQYEDDLQAYFSDVSNLDFELYEDIILRQQIANFKNEWLVYMSNKTAERTNDWRSWNLLRSRLPEKTEIEFEFYGVADTYGELLSACNIVID